MLEEEFLIGVLIMRAGTIVLALIGDSKVKDL